MRAPCLTGWPVSTAVSGALPEPAAARLGRWWLLAAPLAVLAWSAGGIGERALIALGLAVCLGGIVAPSHRPVLGQVAAGSLVAANLCLAARLLGDHFEYWYVWLYSAPELPAYLKLPICGAATKARSCCWPCCWLWPRSG